MCSNDSRNIEFLHKKEIENCSDKYVNLVLRVAKNNHSKIKISVLKTSKTRQTIHVNNLQIL